MDYLAGTAGSIDDLVIEGDEVGFLLAHSIGGAPSECEHAAKTLAARGHSVSCPMLLGHGGSQLLLGAPTWQHWLATLKFAHDRLAEHCTHIIFVGSLTGSMLALKLAQVCPRKPLAIALCAPAVWPQGWKGGAIAQMAMALPFKFAANWLRLVELPPFGVGDAGLRSEFISRAHEDSGWQDGKFCRSGGSAYELKRLVGEVTMNLEMISRPMLMILPSRTVHPYGWPFVEQLERKLGGRVETLILDDSSYRVLEDNQRDAAAQRIALFAETALHEEASLSYRDDRSDDHDSFSKWDE